MRLLDKSIFIIWVMKTASCCKQCFVSMYQSCVDSWSYKTVHCWQWVCVNPMERRESRTGWIGRSARNFRYEKSSQSQRNKQMVFSYSKWDPNKPGVSHHSCTIAPLQPHINRNFNLICHISKRLGEQSLTDKLWPCIIKLNLIKVHKHFANKTILLTVLKWFPST